MIPSGEYAGVGRDLGPGIGAERLQTNMEQPIARLPFDDVVRLDLCGQCLAQLKNNWNS